MDNRQKVLPVSNDDLRKQYEAGDFLYELADKYSCSLITIRKRIVLAGGKIKKPGNKTGSILPVSKDELRKSYNNRLSRSKLAEKYGCSIYVITKGLS